MADILAIAAIVKLLVDAFKLAANPHPWLPATLAILAGIGAAFLFGLAEGGPFTLQTSARSILDGILAAGAAMGLTGLHNAARQENARADITAAIDASRKDQL